MEQNAGIDELEGMDPIEDELDLGRAGGDTNGDGIPDVVVGAGGHEKG